MFEKLIELENFKMVYERKGLTCGFANTYEKRVLTFWHKDINRTAKEASLLLPDPSQLGIFLKAGFEHGLIVIDLDNDSENWEEYYALLAGELGQPTVRTSKMGFHWYCVPPVFFLQHSFCDFFGCIDIIAHGEVMVPPSPQRDGGMYEMLGDELKLCQLTPKLLKMFADELERRLK